MAPKPVKLWKLEPHTAAKHEILRRYLDRWIPIMGYWNPRIAYVDCFAGPGQYEGGEPGSPIVALEIARKFIAKGIIKPNAFTLVAIEAKKSFHQHLLSCCNGYRHIHAELANVNVEILRGQYNVLVANVQRSIQSGAPPAIPTFYLIDPFGVSNLPYELLALLLQPDRNEILFNLMYEETNRFIAAPEFEPHLDAMFGETAWRSLRQTSGVDRKRLLVDYFKERLIAAGAHYVVVFEMRNMRNASDYFLFFASKSLRGLEVMKEAMWAVDRSGNFSFSDYTYSLGPMLIQPAANYTVLQRQIMTRFKDCKSVPVLKIKEFVLTSTSFLRFKSEALRPLIANRECYIEVTPDHPRERLDDQALITFRHRGGIQTSLF